MGFDFLDGFRLRPWPCRCSRVGLTRGVHELHGARDVFMVDGHQCPVIAFSGCTGCTQAEKMHAVVVVARAAGKVALCAVVQIVRNVRINRVTHRVNHPCGVARWHGDAVSEGAVDSIECKCWRRNRYNGQRGNAVAAAPASAQAKGAQSGHGHGTYTTLEYMAAVQTCCQNIFQVRVATGVVLQIVRIDRRYNCVVCL